MSRAGRWGLAGIAIVGLAVLLVSAFRAHRATQAEEQKQDQPIKSAARTSRTPAGETVVQLDRETQVRIGLKTGILVAASLAPEVAAYGRLEEDPSRVFVVRSPLAGTLHFAEGREWPALGRTLRDGDPLGVIEPRLPPVDRVNLTERLAVARADVEAIQASLAAARAAFERTRTLNADNKNMSDRALQEAGARFKGEQARFTAATENARLMEASLKATSGTLTLTAERGGQVVEVLAQPGESVEAGQPIVRLARFDRLLARVAVPAGERVPESVRTARILAVGAEDQPVPAERVGLAPAVDPKNQGRGFLFQLSGSAASLRPGTAVTAYLDLPGPRRQGVIVPRAALVRYMGKVWAYQQISPDRFARREIAQEDLVPAGWFTRALPPGSGVVVVGAQTLLSEEFKSQIQVGEENPE